VTQARIHRCKNYCVRGEQGISHKGRSVPLQWNCPEHFLDKWGHLHLDITFDSIITPMFNFGVPKNDAVVCRRVFLFLFLGYLLKYLGVKCLRLTSIWFSEKKKKCIVI